MKIERERGAHMSECKEKHDPVHFDMRDRKSVWICVACRKQLSGPKLPDDEREALIGFSLAMREKWEEEEKQK